MGLVLTCRNLLTAVPDELGLRCVVLLDAVDIEICMLAYDPTQEWDEVPLQSVGGQGKDLRKEEALELPRFSGFNLREINIVAPYILRVELPSEPMVGG